MLKKIIGTLLLCASVHIQCMVLSQAQELIEAYATSNATTHNLLEALHPTRPTIRPTPDELAELLSVATIKADGPVLFRVLWRLETAITQKSAFAYADELVAELEILRDQAQPSASTQTCLQKYNLDLASPAEYAKALTYPTNDLDVEDEPDALCCCMPHRDRYASWPDIFDHEYEKMFGRAKYCSILCILSCGTICWCCC